MENQSLFDQLGGILGGDKQLGVEVRVNQKDMEKLAIYILVAILIGTIVGNVFSKFLTR